MFSLGLYSFLCLNIPPPKNARISESDFENIKNRKTFRYFRNSTFSELVTWMNLIQSQADSKKNLFKGI